MENLSDNSTISSSSTLDSILGSIYIGQGLIFILLHILVLRVISTDKEMKNPTYYFMINLGVADIIELLIIEVYSGIVIITKWQNEGAQRFVGFLCISAWHSSAFFCVLLAVSRWIAITRPHLTTIVFRRKTLWILQALPWLLFGSASFFCHIIYSPGSVAVFMPQFYTWGFNMENALGRNYPYFNLSYNAVCAAATLILNFLSLHHVRLTRTQIKNLTAMKIRQNEVKLWIQCFILGCVFAMTFTTFTVLGLFPQLASVVSLLIAHFVWTLNHSLNPLVYLAMNRRLRMLVAKTIDCRAGVDG